MPSLKCLCAETKTGKRAQPRLLCLLQYRTEPYTVRWRIHLSLVLAVNRTADYVQPPSVKIYGAVLGGVHTHYVWRSFVLVWANLTHTTLYLSSCHLGARLCSCFPASSSHLYTESKSLNLSCDKNIPSIGRQRKHRFYTPLTIRCLLFCDLSNIFLLNLQIVCICSHLLVGNFLSFEPKILENKIPL